MHEGAFAVRVLPVVRLIHHVLITPRKHRTGPRALTVAAGHLVDAVEVGLVR